MWFGSWYDTEWFAGYWWDVVETPAPTPTPTPTEPSGSGGFLGRMPRMPWADADPWQRRRRTTARPAIRFRDERYDDNALQIDEEDAIVALMMMESR